MAKKHSYRTLIADDESAARHALRLQIETLGHVVVAEAPDGKVAVEQAIQLKPELAILDIRMPELDGILAGKQIMEMVDCPVMLLTGYSDEDLISQAIDAGAFYYLTKPVRIADLLPGIEVAVARFRDQLHVQKRLESRTLIDRAKGILIDDLGLKEADAHKKIHHFARNQNRTMAEIAQYVISNRALPE